jgi:hypothetical protein
MEPLIIVSGIPDDDVVDQAPAVASIGPLIIVSGIVVQSQRRRRAASASMGPLIIVSGIVKKVSVVTGIRPPASMGPLIIVSAIGHRAARAVLLGRGFNGAADHCQRNLRAQVEDRRPLRIASMGPLMRYNRKLWIA